ncbi:hypothetical protein [Aliirhizobium terrae]|uniref:hypothetical protein n=1 Tax=Terrirhizobium terrae TaxID=2926709 RepID=UPI003369D1F8
MVAFYDVVLGTLGLAREPVQTADSPAGFIWQRCGQRWPQFALRSPFDGRPATVGNGVQVSFAAASRQNVVVAWQTAIDNGTSRTAFQGEPTITFWYCAAHQPRLYRGSPRHGEARLALRNRRFAKVRDHGQ